MGRRSKIPNELAALSLLLGGLLCYAGVYLKAAGYRFIAAHWVAFSFGAALVLISGVVLALFGRQILNGCKQWWATKCDEDSHAVAAVRPTSYDLTAVALGDLETVCRGLFTQVTNGCAYTVISQQRIGQILSTQLQAGSRVLTVRCKIARENTPLVAAPETPTADDAPEKVPEPMPVPKPTLPERWTEYPTSHDFVPMRLVWDADQVKESVHQLDWYQFEKLMKLVLCFSEANARVVRRGGAGGDEGVDLLVHRGKETWVVQCKHWRTWRVPPNAIRELMGTVVMEKATKGICITLKGYTQAATAAANGEPLELWGMNEVCELIFSLPVEDREAVFNFLASPPKCCPCCDRELHFPKVGRQRCPFCHGKFTFHAAVERKPRQWWRKH